MSCSRISRLDTPGERLERLWLVRLRCQARDEPPAVVRSGCPASPGATRAPPLIATSKCASRVCRECFAATSTLWPSDVATTWRPRGDHSGGNVSLSRRSVAQPSHAALESPGLPRPEPGEHGGAERKERGRERQ